MASAAITGLKATVALEGLLTNEIDLVRKLMAAVVDRAASAKAIPGTYRR
jgi:hypothetical protein